MQYQRKIKVEIVGEPTKEILSYSAKSAEFLRTIWNDELELCESFYLVCLNQQNMVVGYSMVSKGGVAATVVDRKLLFRDALTTVGCTSIIIAHNHPSGNLRPSMADLKITENIKLGAETLDLKLLDHIILTKDSYYSFIDEGNL